MFANIFEQFTAWFVNNGYLGVFLATLGVFPAEVVIALFAAVRPNEVMPIALVACLGEAIGGIPTYLIGYILNEEKVYRWINGKGKILGIKQANIEESVPKILKHGFWYILVSRLIPWIRIAATLAAGILEMKILPFMAATFIGTFFYAFPIAYIGAKVGNNWTEVQKYLGLYNRWIIAAIILYIVIRYLYKNRKLLQKRLEKVLNNKRK